MAQRHLGIAALLVGSLVLAAGCAQEADPGADGVGAILERAATTTVDAPESVASSDDSPRPPLVELLEAGAEPRTVVRFDPASGTEQLVTMHQEQLQRLTAEGHTEELASPPTEMDLRYRVEEVRDGRISTVLTYEDARVVAGPDDDPSIVASLDETLRVFAGAQASTVFDDRGFVLASSPPDVDLTGTDAAFMQTFVESISAQQSAMVMPFPEEAVGPGARWRVTSRATVSGLEIESVFTLHLLGVDDGTVTATVDTQLRFVPGPVDMFGQQARVESGELVGQGEVRWRLGGIAPLLAQSIEGTVIISLEQDDQTIRLEQYQRQTLSSTER